MGKRLLEETDGMELISRSLDTEREDSVQHAMRLEFI